MWHTIKVFQMFFPIIEIGTTSAISIHFCDKIILKFKLVNDDFQDW